MRGLDAVCWALLALCPATVGAGDGDTETPARYRYAYYLFVVGPVAAGADRSIPLLLTPRALEQADAADSAPPGTLVWTYERDSVSRVTQGVAIRPEHVKAHERHVQVPGFDLSGDRRWYRYQSVALAEARQLLEHPEGVIPVHRMGVSRELLDALGAALREE